MRCDDCGKLLIQTRNYSYCGHCRLEEKRGNKK